MSGSAAVPVHRTGANASADTLAFPRLPVLERVLDSVIKRHAGLLDGFTVVAVQHLLETTGSLLESLFRLGLRPNRTYVLGKIYSTNRGVARALAEKGVNVCLSGPPERWGEYSERMRQDVNCMWGSVVKSVQSEKPRGIIVLDDGGHAVAATPDAPLKGLEIRAVEQTSSGLRRINTPNAAEGAPVVPITTVQVAASAAKTLLEPDLISEAVFRRVRQMDGVAGLTCGVAGTGHIGSAIARGLQERRSRVIAFDTEPANVRVDGVTVAFKLRELFRAADVIFGCSGVDVLEGSSWWSGLEGSKVLASCSSQDHEFRSVLTAYNAHAQVDNALRDVCYPLGRGELRILRGGFPVNFDGSSESVPARDIQLTRGLLLAGVVQAAYGCLKPGRKTKLRERLSSAMQRTVVNTWFDAEPGWKHHFEERAARTGAAAISFDDDDWIAVNSGGEHGVEAPL
jgi:S-adenosylhomocysteine hydrolase